MFSIKIESIRFQEGQIQGVAITSFDKALVNDIVKQKLSQLSLRFVSETDSPISYSYGQDGYLYVTGFAYFDDPDAPLMQYL